MVRQWRVDELPETPLEEVDMRYQELSVNRKGPEIPPEPYLEIQVIPEDPEEISVREGIHERIQAEIHHEDKEVETAVKEMLEIPLEWNEVPDLMTEDKDVRPTIEAAVKRKIDEVAWWRRKWRNEDDIHPEKHAHSPTVSRRTQNTEGFYSEDWNEALQELKMNGRRQINGKGLHRWCFVADV